MNVAIETKIKNNKHWTKKLQAHVLLDNTFSHLANLLTYTSSFNSINSSFLHKHSILTNMKTYWNKKSKLKNSKRGEKNMNNTIICFISFFQTSLNEWRISGDIAGRRKCLTYNIKRYMNRWLNAYCKNTGLHGFRYITMDRATVIDSAFWSVVRNGIYPCDL